MARILTSLTASDGYGRLNRFTITGVLYVPDFITNIVSMRLTKERAGLYFETQFGRIYDANGYICTCHNTRYL